MHAKGLYAGHGHSAVGGDPAELIADQAFFFAAFDFEKLGVLDASVGFIEWFAWGNFRPEIEVIDRPVGEPE